MKRQKERLKGLAWLGSVKTHEVTPFQSGENIPAFSVFLQKMQNTGVYRSWKIREHLLPLFILF